MTTVVTASNSEVTAPTSYVSRWIAQSHVSYQKKSDDYYSSTCDCRISTSPTMVHNVKIPTKLNSNVHTTTWQAQARTRLENMVPTMTSGPTLNTSNNVINSDLQEKLDRIR